MFARISGCSICHQDLQVSRWCPPLVGASFLFLRQDLRVLCVSGGAAGYNQPTGEYVKLTSCMFSLHAREVQLENRKCNKLPLIRGGSSDLRCTFGDDSFAKKSLSTYNYCSCLIYYLLNPPNFSFRLSLVKLWKLIDSCKIQFLFSSTCLHWQTGYMENRVRA